MRRNLRPRIESLEPRRLLAVEPLVISELMAINQATLVDEDGQFSDWIEIHNAGSSAVSLADWYVTDEADELTKWRFPAQDIGPGEHLLVFASGKDRAVAGAELHTNFSLAGDGEYLALVKDDPIDGLSIASQYAPEFPSQLEDVSFGLVSELVETPLVAAGASATYHVPSDDSLGFAWTDAAFDEAAWSTADTGIGYDTGGSAAPPIATLAHWPLDGDGVAAVGPDGVVTGATAAADRDGTPASALAFGTTDVMTVASAPSLETADLAFDMWVRPDTLGQHANVFSKQGADEGYSYGLELLLNDRLRFFVQTADGEFRSVDSAGALQLGVWHHVAGVYDSAAGTIRLFVDGRETFSAISGVGIGAIDHSAALDALLVGDRPQLGGGGPVASTLLANEPFDYGTGDLLGEDGGAGWAGPWTQHYAGGSLGVSQVNANSLQPPAGTPGEYATGGNHAYFTERRRDGRFLDTSAGGPFTIGGGSPVDYIDGAGNVGADGTSIYFSFLQQPNQTSHFYAFEIKRDGLADANAVLYVGNDQSNPAGLVQVRAYRNASLQDDLGAGTTDANLYVMRIDFNAGNDDVYVYRNPTSTTEPATADGQLIGVGDLSFDAISLATFLNGVAVAHDEIRLGPTYQDVLGGGTTGPSVGTAALPAIDGTLDELRLYDSALTGLHIRQLAEQPAPLAGHWTLDETSGDLADSSGNGNTGVNSGATYGNGANGQIEGAMDFDGTDRVVVADSPTLRSDSLSLSAWVRPDATGAQTHVLGKERSGGTSYGLEVLADGRANFFVFNSGGYRDVKSTATLTTGTWQHLAATYDATTATASIYVDGVDVSTQRGGSGVGGVDYTSPGDLSIGARSNLNSIDGLIDDVSVWDVALSGAEVATLAADGPAGVLGQRFDVSTVDFTPLLGTGGDVEATMLGQNASIYVRSEFTLVDPGEVDQLLLRLRYDDGAAVYVNGTLIAQRNTPSVLGWDAAAVGARPDAAATAAEIIDLTALKHLLTVGVNVLAVHGLNAGATSPDLLVLPELVSVGIDPNSLATRYFTEPTPGQPNNDGMLGIVSDTTFSVDRGYYDAPFPVAIETATPDAEIRYTIDGSLPTATHGNVYSGPITIDGTTTLRAAAFKDGFIPTNADTQTYIFLDEVIAQPTNPPGMPNTWNNYYIGWPGTPVPADYEMDPDVVGNPLYAESIRDDLQSLPVMSIVMDHEGLFGLSNGIYTNPFLVPPNSERAASVEYFAPDGREIQIDAGIRISGGWSRHWHASPKKTFSLTFKRDFGPPKLDFPLFEGTEVDQFDRIMLRAVFSDAWPDAASPPQYLRDLFTRQTQLDMGQASSHGTWVHLYLNGLYWGIYNPSERPDASFGASYYGGEKEEYDAIKHAGLAAPGVVVNNSYEVIDGDDAAWQTALSLAAGGLADSASYETFKQYVDVENLADYIIVNTYLSNVDWPHKNWYALRKREPGAGFKFFVWDSEYTLNDVNVNRTGVNNANTPAALYAAARANDEFRLMFADRVHKHLFNDGALQVAANQARYEALAGEIDRAIVGESARWGDNNTTRQGATFYTRDGNWLPVKNTVLNTYFPQRHAIALSQYISAGLYPNVPAPEFGQHGGEVAPGYQLTMTAPGGGAIYFTFDDTDPRGEAPLVETTVLVETGAAATARVPTGPLADNTWRDVGFDDAAWIAGATGVGYERGGGTYQALLGIDLLSGSLDPGQRIDTTVPADGTNENDSVLIRVPFTGADTTDAIGMTLKMQYDDGFVAYLNGTEIARALATDPIVWNSSADIDHPDDQALNFVSFDATTHLGLLQPGQNVLAIHALNANPTSSDMLIVPRLELISEIEDPGGDGPQLYTGPVTIDASTVVKARVLNGTTWSALNEAAFIVDIPSPLRITEIMFNQPGSDDAEFIELQNTGDAPIDLGGVALTDGVDFTFPSMQLDAWQFVVVARNAAAFEATYGTAGILLAGQFADGGLSNGGEQLELTDAFGETIQQFTYNDTWFRITDGLGFSLVPIDPADLEQDFSDNDAWRPSTHVGGSPGEADPLPPALPGDVVVSEVMTNPASGSTWIELHNTTGQTIDLGGWFISDDARTPNKVALAAGKSIPSGGYLLLTEQDDFGPTVDPLLGFSLSPAGGEVSLAAGAAPAAMLGFQVVRDFDGSDIGISIGRHVNSIGNVDFVPLATATPGVPNDAPVIGPAVINEIMYHPLDGQVEFIELHNATSSPLPLFDAAAPANTWSISGGVSFAMPTGVTIPAESFALIVPIDPAAFRSQYGLPAETIIMGPYGGSLSNGGETVRLFRPGQPLPGGIVPQIHVDRVEYDDELPWVVAADGSGPSLERIDASRYGNEPTNWMRSAFGGSPGRANTGIDQTPPDLPTDVTLSATGPGTVALSWTAADDPESGVSQYRVYRNNQFVGTATDTLFIDTSAPAAGSIAYRVSAVNGDDIEGSRSSTATLARLQQEVSPSDGYAGADDVTLRENNASTNFGTETAIIVDVDEPDGTSMASVALLRWDVSSLPADAIVESVSITVNALGSVVQPYQVFAAMQPWVENEATWNEYATGVAWDAPGAAGANDRGTELLGTVEPSGSGAVTVALNAAGVALVQAWIDGASANHGFVLAPHPDNTAGGGTAVIDDLLAFYPFEQIDGASVADASENNRTATATNVTVDAGGFDGAAFRFHGNGHVVAPVDINPSVAPNLTMGAWVKASAIGPGLYKILGHDNGGWDRTVGMDTRGIGGFRWTAFIGNGEPVPNTPAPVFDQWTFIAAVYDQTANTITLYVDLDATTTDDAPAAFSNPTGFAGGWNTVAIGNIRPDNFSEAFTGLMDNVFFINDTLDAATIRQIRDGGEAFFLGGGLAIDASESPDAAQRPTLHIGFTVPPEPAQVVGQYLFYDNSGWDGGPGPDAGDDAAIATDKTALEPGQPATRDNYSSFSGGINGLMIDVDGLIDPARVDATDFTLKTGNDDDPTGWTLAAAPSHIAVREGAGIGGSDRVTIAWTDGAIPIQNAWLEVTALAGGHMGLDAPVTFYFGNAVGETGNDAGNALVTAADVIGVRDHPRGAANRADIDDRFDFNRDRHVDALDAILARNHATSPLAALRLITPAETAAAPPLLPVAEGAPPLDASVETLRTVGAGGAEAPPLVWPHADRDVVFRHFAGPRVHWRQPGLAPFGGVRQGPERPPVESVDEFIEEFGPGIGKLLTDL